MCPSGLARHSGHGELKRLANGASDKKFTAIFAMPLAYYTYGVFPLFCLHPQMSYLDLFFCWLMLIGFNPYGCFVSTPTLLIPPQSLVKFISLFSSWYAFGQCLATSRDFHPKATELRCQSSLPKLPPPCADCLYGNPTSCVPRP